MQNFKDLEKSLRNDPQKGKLLESAAASEEGRRVMRSVDGAKVEQALKSGDTAALKNILSQVLSTPDGQALAKMLQKNMGSK